MKNANRARNRGSVAALAFVAMVPLMAAIGGFSVDVMHYNDETAALQRATDAAALGGAYNLTSYTGNKANSATAYNSSANEMAVNDALKIATLNWVDGRSVTTNSAGINVTATLGNTTGTSVSFTPLATGTKPNVKTPDACQVIATMQISSLFAKMFKNFGQTVDAVSVAGGTNMTVESFSSGTAYPLIVGLNDGQPLGTPKAGIPLKGTTVNSDFYWTCENRYIKKDGKILTFPPNASYADLSETSTKSNTTQKSYGTPGDPGGRFNDGGGTYASGSTYSVKLGQKVDVDALTDTEINYCDAQLVNNVAPSGTPNGTILICPVVDTVNDPDKDWQTVRGFVEIKLTKDSTFPTASSPNIFKGKIVQTVSPGINLTNGGVSYTNPPQPLLPHLIR